MELLNKKLLVCICYTHSESRLEYLKKIIFNCLSYKMQVKIIIDTNEHNESINKLSNNNVIIKVHTSLSHPFNLTWKNRFSMVDEIYNHDYFMYLEDDMLLPFENFVEYVENFEHLYPLNFIPSFIRIEEHDSKKYVTDVINQQIGVFTTVINGKTFASLTEPYHAFWIMPQKELKESINETFISNDSINRELSASYPMWHLQKVPLVLLNKNVVDELSYSFHLSNNYAPNPHTHFGKIQVENLIINP